MYRDSPYYLTLGNAPLDIVYINHVLELYTNATELTNEVLAFFQINGFNVVFDNLQPMLRNISLLLPCFPQDVMNMRNPNMTNDTAMVSFNHLHKIYSSFNTYANNLKELMISRYWPTAMVSKVQQSNEVFRNNGLKIQNIG
ncbi:hypothetical protein GEMRC1_012341 [Eukaryota sp. GEM-RC1]